jgi:hypothetical protein
MDSIISRYVELHPSSQKLHERALRLFPNGVTHDLRHASPFPLYARRAAAAASGMSTATRSSTTSWGTAPC